MKTLVIGWAGSGKSTICLELQSRGHTAFDSDDIPGLSSWQDIATHQLVQVDFFEPIDFEKVTWRWNSKVFDSFITENESFILCGNASNAAAFFPLFDRILALSLPAEVQRKRLLTRTNNDYGKEPTVIERTIKKQRELEVYARANGFPIIDASQPIKVVVDTVAHYVAEQRQ